jgi:hypothetical protein
MDAADHTPGCTQSLLFTPWPAAAAIDAFLLVEGRRGKTNRAVTY